VVDHGIAARMERPGSDVDFHRWLAERHRHRAARLAWTLVGVMIAAAAIVTVLMVQLDDAAQRYDAARAEVRRLDRRLDQVVANSQTRDRAAQRNIRCLENRVAHVSKGLQRLLQGKISVPTYVRRYGRPARCR